MKMKYHLRSVRARILFCFLLIAVGIHPSFSGEAGAADLSVLSSENLYSSLGSGSAGTPYSPKEGQINGRVVDLETGEKVAGMHVFARQADSFKVELLWPESRLVAGQAAFKMENYETYEAVTAGDGKYLLDALPVGVYALWAHETNGQYLKKNYDDTTAGLVYVRGGTAVDSVDFSMQKGAVFKGRVVVKADGKPVVGAKVTVLDQNRKNVVSAAVSGNDGSYLVLGLPDGKYLVKVEKEGFVGSYLGGQEKPQTAKTLYVRNRTDIDGIDFFLERNALVKGLVSDAAGGPLENIRIEIFEFDGEVISAQPLKYSKTDKEGRYALDKLPPGRYVVKAEASSRYLPKFYDKDMAGGAAAIFLEDGQALEDIDFKLLEGGGIRGKVVNEETGGPAPNVSIQVVDSVSGKIAGRANTDRSGLYTVDRMPAGLYTISAESSGFARKYWDNAAGHETAALVTISQGTVLDNVDFSLRTVPSKHSGAISGTITWGYDGSPLQGGCVQTYIFGATKMVGSSCSGSDGIYSVSALPDGDYRVYVKGFSGYIPEFFNNVDYRKSGDATPVSIKSGGRIAGIDFALARMGSVRGTIFRASDMEAIGTYEVRAEPGTYLVRVTSAGSGYLTDPEGGDERSVIIHDGQTLSAIDFVLSVAPDL